MRRRGCKRRGDERMRVAVIMLTTRVVSEHSTHVGRGCSSEHAPLEAAPTVTHKLRVQPQSARAPLHAQVRVKNNSPTGLGTPVAGQNGGAPVV